jgi:hypothetical protein
MNAMTRHAILIAALGATLWLAFRDRSELSDSPQSETTGAQSTAVTKANPPHPQRSRQSIEAAQADPFFAPAPKPKPEVRKAVPVVAPAPPAPPPSAPPLPFTYFGRLAGPTGATSIFIANGSALLPVKAGDIVDGRYRVEQVSDDEIVFVYLPLGLRQTLRISS